MFKKEPGSRAARSGRIHEERVSKRFTFTGRDGRRRREGGSEQEEGIIDEEEGETKHGGNMVGPMS